MKKKHNSQASQPLDAGTTPDPTMIPLTADDLVEQRCPQCGALLPQGLRLLDAIPGQAHLRRAVTVALTGRHPITFIGTGSTLPDALAFGRISRAYGLTAYATMPCRCGNHGDPYLTCICTPEAIAAWRGRPEFRAALQADIVVEAAYTSAEQRIAHRQGRRGEPDEAIVAQATEARKRPRPGDELDGASQRLLTAAIRQLQLTTEQVARVLAVARSIAQLADARAIRPVHLAEAVQYRSRIAVTPEVLEPEGPQEVLPT